MKRTRTILLALFVVPAFSCLFATEVLASRLVLNLNDPCMARSGGFAISIRSLK